MTLLERIDALDALGKCLENVDIEPIANVLQRTENHNRWFTIAHQKQALAALKDAFLQKNALKKWSSAYKIEKKHPITEGVTNNDNSDISTLSHVPIVGLVLAGNIPLVGFHDILCVFMAGLRCQIKVSDKDPFLLPMLLKMLAEIDARTADYFHITERLRGFDAVIATGSNNSARYFEAYFGKYPHIIRKNRNAIAILNGAETSADFRKLSDDIFQYFGLGCRNVSKMYVPTHYDFKPLLEVLHERNELVLHDKYKNNFDYNFTLLILNCVKYESNGCILMRESPEIVSPIAVLNYEFYDDIHVLNTQLQEQKDAIQLVVSGEKMVDLPTFVFGEAQKPRLSDYADGIDTMQFLCDL